MVNPVPTLSRTCAGWANTAGFTVDTYDDATTLRSAAGHGTSWYQIRDRGRGRVELTEIDHDGDEHSELFAAGMDVLERYLIGLLGDVLREELALDYLDLPWKVELVAPGYTLGPLIRGYRTLSRTDGSPVAAARDETLSLVKLVPLSQFMAHDLETLKRAFLSPTGAPLLAADGCYRNHESPYGFRRI
ncbi:TNT antitoxin family protein [Mycolicibacterium llatzerense]|uniref:TNT antitoxin family protein n=1 Tax=Mycolicibacterium llatzerense TaxID=280871 RepID=UPI0021B4D94E|nr:TNT antitoxin family protein [Mycolicibacterium llatzerense]